MSFEDLVLSLPCGHFSNTSSTVMRVLAITGLPIIGEVKIGRR